jgi:hypothetical protein
MIIRVHLVWLSNLQASDRYSEGGHQIQMDDEMQHAVTGFANRLLQFTRMEYITWWLSGMHVSMLKVSLCEWVNKYVIISLIQVSIEPPSYNKEKH